ncbi:MAG: M20/M25/M40 family metallo-hydrolase [Acidobacteria bacterium]|nr:M20/M25/M40 family metallo-hydrolase [Acidobacteriota bacterium]
MRRRARVALALPFLVLAATTANAQKELTAHADPPAGGPAWLEAYRAPASRLIGEAVSSTFAWDRLATLTDTIGNRLSGTAALDRAIQWAVAEMTRDGLENVHTERVMVPKWLRGSESAEIVEPVRHQIAMLGLGDSIGTPADGVQGDVLVVHSFEELDAKASAARGRIVLFNVPFTSYGETVRFRSMGPSRAARHGAVAMLVRAVGPSGLRTPHTGALSYTSDAPKIPAAAISTEDADRLQRMTDRGGRVVVRLKMEAHFDADVPSANVVGEIRGRERPDEVVVVSGHLDSWDVGAGATDDGGGCVVTWEAVRLMKKLNLRPRRTVRVVLWTNEENGGRGGTAYRDQHRAELGKHVLMLESDGGVFRPQGFGFTGSDAARETVKTIATLLSGIAADQISPGGGGADIGPSMQEGHVPGMSLDVDGSKYFLIHHTAADTVDKIDPVEMAKCAAAVAVMAYVVADLPQRLGE